MLSVCRWPLYECDCWLDGPGGGSRRRGSVGFSSNFNFFFLLFIKTTALIFPGQSQAISCSKSVLKGIRVIIFYTLDYCMPALSFQPHEHRNDLIEEVAAGYCAQWRLHVTCMTESYTIRPGINKTCSLHCHRISSQECLYHRPVGSECSGCRAPSSSISAFAGQATSAAIQCSTAITVTGSLNNAPALTNPF